MDAQAMGEEGFLEAGSWQGRRGQRTRCGESHTPTGLRSVRPGALKPVRAGEEGREEEHRREEDEEPEKGGGEGQGHGLGQEMAAEEEEIEEEGRQAALHKKSWRTAK